MSPAVINERARRGRKAAEARLLRERTLRLLRTEIEFISNKSFRTIDRELEREVLAGTTPFEAVTSPVPKSLPSHLARMCETSVLTPEQEQRLFRQMNYLKYRANALRSRLNPHAPDEAMVMKVERFLSAAQEVRDHLVKANMRLAISIVKKFVTPRNSFDDMLSDGVFSLIQAVDKFDYDRGFRFSTYAYRAIARNAYRAILKRQQESARSVDEVNESHLDSAAARPESAMDIQTWLRLRSLLSQMMTRLDRREQLIIRCRYALGAHRKVKTFQTIADRLGVSKERVRQLEQRAMTKLRTLAAQSNIEELLSASLN